MPALPQFSPRADVSPVPQQRVAPNAFAQVAQAQENTANAAQNFSQALYRANIETQVNGARLRWSQALGEARAQIETVGDPMQIRPTWDRATREAVDAVSRDIIDPAARRQFQGLAALDIAREHGEIARLTVRRTTEAGRAVLEASLDDMARQSFQDPSRRQDLDRQANAAIERSVLAGIIPADQAERQRQRYFGRLEQAAIGQAIIQNPAQALAMLRDPRMTANIDPQQQVQLVGAATNAMNARATAGMAAEMRAQRQQRLLADQGANELEMRFAQAERGEGPAPTLEDINRYREWLSPGEFRTLTARSRDWANIRTDPGVRVELETQVDAMPPDQFAARVAREVQQRRLSGDDAAGLIRANRAARRDDQPPSPTQTARRFVDTALNPGDVPMSQFMREALQARQANGMSDMDRWLRDNPNATHAQAEEAARGIVARYRTASAGELRNSLPLPMGYSGGRSGITEQTLQQAAQRVMAMPDGAQRERETQTLRDWTELLRMDQQQRPAPRTQGGRTAPNLGPSR